MPTRLACRLDELDPETRDYLLGVRRANGRGVPGLYVNRGNAAPWFAVILGPVICVAAFVVSLGSPKDAWAVAMLQTAGVLLGGWLVLYAVRRWMTAGTPGNGGRFVVFDPLHIHEVECETVRLTGLNDVNGVEAIGGENPQVKFTFAGDRAQLVAVPTKKIAGRVEDYYAALAELEASRDGSWAVATHAERGAAAIVAVDDGEAPRNTSDIRLEFDTVPESPAKDRTNRGGFLPLLLLPVVAVGVFSVCWLGSRIGGDELAFQHAQENGAAGLRSYLLDDRNVRHREDAKRLLAAAYDPAVQRLRAAPGGTKPELRDGMVKLIDSLRTADQGVVSLRFREQVGTGNPPTFVENEGIRQAVADSLARSIGPDLVAFAAAADGKPGHIDVTYCVGPLDVRTGRQPVTVTVAIRTDVATAPVAEAVVPPTDPVQIFLPGIEARDVVCSELAGGFTQPPPFIQDGDF